ncbi:MAG: UDP-N-acetylmuramoyl-tripeptide--D-alanyl-D-alanine ligase, partial [Micrococcales bacterium]|nr:UDP-N-acetylmuramoyl-tripeptide--D-alanyl-D-alanine ligase [Micrococcales bacterium]
MGMTVGFVAKATGGKLGGGADSAARVTGAVLDSRKVSPGDLFIAARGEHSDGHSFVDSARKHGAVLALVERPVDAPHVLVPDVTTALGDLARAHLVHLRKVVGRIRVAAITGSVGKTTTKDLLARIAAGAGNTVASQASYNNHFGVPLTVLRADETTDFLIVEIGANHRGEIAALSAIAPPDVACVLAVAPAHLGEFGSIEEVAAAKAELLGALRPGGTAVLNNADPRVRAMHTGDAARLTFGAAPDAQLCIEEVSVDPEGRIAIVLKLLGGVRRIATGMRGEHHATNLAA